MSRNVAKDIDFVVVGAFATAEAEEDDATSVSKIKMTVRSTHYNEPNSSQGFRRSFSDLLGLSVDGASVAESTR